MATPDYSTWLTKAAAAEAIGVSTKTIEQWASERKLEQASWRPDGRGPLRAVYNPDDVARIASERHVAPAPFVLPAGSAIASGNNGRHGIDAPSTQLARVSSTTSADDLVRDFLHGLLRAASAPTSENSEKLFVSIAEAAAITGLTQAYLRRAIEDKRLPAIRDVGWRIRRKDLETL